MIGQKGMPATWGGVERHVEELSAELVERGHDVTVFTRPHYTDSKLREWRGVHLVSVWSIHSKYTDAITHSLLCSLRSFLHNYDIVHYHGIGPSLFAPLAAMRRGATVATVHGQDWRGGKWGRFARCALMLGERQAVLAPDATIAVSQFLAEYYAQRWNRPVVAIPSGVAVESERDASVLRELDLKSGSYMLFVGRLVPEKGLDYLFRAMEGQSDLPPLVVVGDASLSQGYVAHLRETAPCNVVFAGYRFGSQLATLYEESRLLVAPSTHEGLPLVLLEGLAYGVPLLVSDIPPMREVLGGSGTYFAPGDSADLRRALMLHVRDPRGLELDEGVQLGILRRYGWGSVAERVEAVYAQAWERKTLRTGRP
jgi:glycosyltransferase involved in cell wall biosynthesis